MALESRRFLMASSVIAELKRLVVNHGDMPVMLECDWSSIKRIEFVEAGGHSILDNEDDMIVIDSSDVPF